MNLKTELVSIFTPCHDTRWLTRAYQSLRQQTHLNWEWVIYLNGEAEQDFSFDDLRVKIFQGNVTGSCGACKLEAVKKCRGEWLVELDHDDELTPTCLEEIVSADADFVYSNCAICKNETDTGELWNRSWGWHYRDFSWSGLSLKEIVSPQIHPANWGFIFYAPDHVRAFRQSYYWKIGGHNPKLTICDDHELTIRA